MSLQYIIDGYNIINHPLFAHIHKKIKNSRIALLEFIRIKRLCGSPKNKATVIFDGYSKPEELKQNNNDINVIFSRTETADKEIKRMVEASSNPRNIVVVSDDNEIRFFIRSLGAHCVSVEDFINSPSAGRGKVNRNKNLLDSQKKESLKPELTYSQIQRINQEFKKIWLK